jgi:cardiolipin synthase
VIAEQLPNLISGLRVAASPALVWLLVGHEFRASLALIAFAGITDWLDGFTARRFGVAGRTGTVLDPLADKIMLLTLFITLTVIGKVPGYVLAVVIARDLVIVIGASLLRVLRKVRTFLPTMLGKVSTFFQIAYVLTVVLDAGFPNRVFNVLRLTGLACTLCFTVASGIGYVQKGIQLTRATAHVQAR